MLKKEIVINVKYAKELANKDDDDFDDRCIMTNIYVDGLCLLSPHLSFADFKDKSSVYKKIKYYLQDENIPFTDIDKDIKIIFDTEQLQKMINLMLGDK